MSLVTIFSRSAPSVGGATFDATLEESTEMTTEVTGFPVENGAEASDNTVQVPLSITLTVGISDNPFRAARAGISALIGTTGGALISQLGGGSAAVAGLSASVVNAAYAAGQAATRSQSVLDTIREIQRRGEAVEVATSKRVYENCVITRTSQTTSKENEQGLELVIEMRQLLITETETIDEAPVPGQQPAGDTASTMAAPRINYGESELQ